MDIHHALHALKLDEAEGWRGAALVNDVAGYLVFTGVRILLGNRTALSFALYLQLHWTRLGAALCYSCSLVVLVMSSLNLFWWSKATLRAAAPVRPPIPTIPIPIPIPSDANHSSPR